MDLPNFNFDKRILDDMWVCKEDSPKDIMNEVKIPKYLKEDVKLKELLANISKQNEKEVFKWLIDSSYKDTLGKTKYLAMNIAFFAKLFTMQCKFYYDLSRDLGNHEEYGPDFKKALLSECISVSSGRLLRLCLDGGIFSKDEVWDRLKSNLSFDLCFFVVTALTMPMKQTIFEKCPPNANKQKIKEDDLAVIDHIIKNVYQKDTLEYYIKEDDVEGVKKMISKPDFDKDKRMSCPYGLETEEARFYVDFACFFKSKRVLPLLLDRGCKLSPSALMNAILAGDIDTFKLIKAKGNFTLAGAHFGLALKFHRWDIANYVLQTADCSRQFGMSLMTMIQWRNPRAVMYGLATGRPVNDPKAKEGPLSVACRVGEVNVALALIEKGASVQKLPDYYPHSPLTLACQFGHSDLARLLIARGADPTAVLLGRTALIAACEYGHDTELVKFLLDKEGDVYQEEYSSDPRAYEKTKRLYDSHREFRYPTALCYAARSGCLETVKLLLKYKPAIIGSLPNGETLMTWAVRGGNVDVVRTLDESGASLTQKSTPPLLSIPPSNDLVYRYLFDHGANDRMTFDDTYPLYKMPYTFERRLLKKTATEGQLKAFTYANQAASALKLRDTGAAAKMINASLQSDPQCSDAHRASALLLLRLKDTRLSTMLARAALSVAAGDEPRQRILRSLAKCARVAGDFSTEIDALSEAYRSGDRWAGQKLLVAYCSAIGRGEKSVENIESLIAHVRAPESSNNLQLAKCIAEFCRSKTVRLSADERFIESCLGDTRGGRGHSGADMALSYFPEIASSLRPGMKFGLAAHDFAKKSEVLRARETAFGRCFELRESDAALEAGDAAKQAQIADGFLQKGREVLGKAKFGEAIALFLLAIECFGRAQKDVPFPVYSNLATAAAQAEMWPLSRIASVLTLAVKNDHAKTYEKLPRIAKEMGAKWAEEKLTELAADVKKGGEFSEFAKRANALLSLRAFVKGEEGDAMEEMKTKVTVGALGWKYN